MMKNKNLLNLVERKSYEQTRKDRHSLDPILSRFSLASLICLCMLTIGSGNAWADYTVGFATSGSDVISSGGDYVTSATAGGYTIIESSGLRFGSGGNTGSIEVVLTSSGTNIGQIHAIKVTLKNVVRYGTDSSVGVKYTITYTDDSKTSDTYTAPTSATDKDIDVDPSKTIKSVKIESTANSKRFYCQGFTVSAATAATITLSEAGTATDVSGSHYATQSYTLPSSTEVSCGEKVLVGWSTVTVAETNTKPTSNFYKLGQSVTLAAGSNTFYAVFANRSGTEATWVKVTDAPSDWSGDYVIAHSTSAKAMISDFYSGTSGEFKSDDITINAAGTQITSEPTEKMIWTFAKNGNNAQYSLQNLETGTYAKITASGSTDAALSESAVWFTISSSGTSGIWKIISVTYSGRCFAWYATYSTFRTYASSSNNTGRLFKKNGGYSYSAYSTTCCEPLGAVDGDLSFTKTAYTITATWPMTEDEHETGYSVQLYDNNGSGAKGSAIGSPVAITGTGSANRTCTFGAKTPAGSRLTANHQYFIGVTPTYSGAGDYCSTGTEVVGNTTTNPVYTVTYAAGTGGTGTKTDPNSPYEAGDEVTVLDNNDDFTRCGHNFNGWSAADASSNPVDVSSGSFTMPASNVTITATWASKQDIFYDYMHEHTAVGKNYYSTQSGNYTSPAAISDETPGEACEGKHYKFMGWVEADYINEDGTLKDGFTLIPASQSGQCADGKTFYAIWAEEE